jgi:hypothetical protein
MENNIFHYCKTCKKITITEMNIYNRLGQNVTMKNGDLKIFEVKMPGEEKFANYFTKNNIIYCKNCNSTIGYTSKHYGVISIEAIESKQVSFHKNNNKNKVAVFIKHEIELHILAKKVKMILENLKNFLRDFYFIFYVPIIQLLEEIKDRKDKLKNIILNKEVL